MDAVCRLTRFVAPFQACAALAVAAISMSAFADLLLAGDWRVEGDCFSGEATLPGTLAAAHLGKRWTERDFQTTMDLPQSEPSCCLSGKLTTNPFVFFMDGETLRWQKGMWYNSRRNKS